MPRDFLKIKDLYLEEYKIQFKEEIKKQKEFYRDLPDSLGLTKESINKVLDDNIDKIKTEFKNKYEDSKDIYYEFKTSKPLRKIYKNSINNISETISITYKEETVYFLYLLDEIKTLINNKSYVSNFKLENIKNLIKNFYVNNSNEIYKSILGTLETLLILYASSITTYLKNKKTFQQKSLETFKENTKTLECVSIKDPFNIDVSTSKLLDISNIDNLLSENFNCDINGDNVIVPHEPFDKKENNFSCEILTEEEIEIDDKPVSNDLSTKAIIEGNFKNIYISTGDNVNENTIIGITDTRSVISPVIGYILSISNNSILIDNISDPLVSPEVLKSQELINLYKESIAIKNMITQYYILSILPNMLVNCVNIDNFISPEELLKISFHGVKILYNKKINEYENIIKDYENNIKEITSSNNIKTKAENEDIETIKKDIEKEEENVFNNIKELYFISIEDAKLSVGIPGDFTLKNYYEELYSKLSLIESPITIQQEFIDKIKSYINNRIGIVIDEKFLIKEEAVYIESYFNNLFSSLISIDKQIIEVTNQLKNYNNFTPYSIKNINNEDYRYYKVLNDNEDTCILEDNSDNPYLSSKTIKQYNDISYWLKYCSYATLGSVINYPRGWSTGFVGPNGPVLFPVVYVPIKPISTSFGFIVIGLTICGIYPFPFILMSNFTANYTVPIGDPTQSIKQEIKSFKLELTTKIKDFKEKVFKEYLEEKTKQINQKEEDIVLLKEQLIEHKNNKPKKSKFTDLEMTQKYEVTLQKIDYTKQYAELLLKWEEDKLKLQSYIEIIKIEKFMLEEEYKIIYDISTIGKSKDKDKIEITDPKIKAIEETQKLIEKLEEKITKLLDKINLVLSVLPISLAPMSASFGPTIKKPDPVIKIEDELDDNINKSELKLVTKDFDLSNDIFLKENFNEILGETPIGNYEKYLNKLKAKMNLIVKKDSFPKYENLTPINLAWTKFIINNWTPKAATIFGIPGQLPT
jgi:hypothetical protein